jgi:hypothetical protein
MPKERSSGPRNEQEQFTTNQDGSYQRNPGIYQVNRQAPFLPRNNPVDTFAETTPVSIPRADKVLEPSSDIPTVEARITLEDVLDNIEVASFSKKKLFQDIINTEEYKEMPAFKKLATLMIVDKVATKAQVLRHTGDYRKIEENVKLGADIHSAKNSLKILDNYNGKITINHEQASKKIKELMGIGVSTRKELIDSLEIPSMISNNLKDYTPKNINKSLKNKIINNNLNDRSL